MNSRKNAKLREKVKPCTRTQNNAKICKSLTKMPMYTAFAQNNARMRQNSLFFLGKIGRAELSVRKLNQIINFSGPFNTIVTNIIEY